MQSTMRFILHIALCQSKREEPLGESQLNLTNTLLQGAFRPQTPCLNFAPPNKNPKSAPVLGLTITTVSSRFVYKRLHNQCF